MAAFKPPLVKKKDVNNSEGVEKKINTDQSWIVTSCFMSTYIQLIYHIVFTPKHRSPILEKSNRPILFKYITGILSNKKCHLYQMNGVEDHIHILTHIHPTISLSNLVKDIKVASSLFIKSENLFPLFQEWQVGYGGFTCSFKDIELLINYMKR